MLFNSLNYDERLIPLPRAKLPLVVLPIYTPIVELPNLKDIPGSNIYTHHKIPHYKSIIGFTIENGKTYVLVTNWTSTNNPINNVIQGTKLGKQIDTKHLKNLC